MFSLFLDRKHKVLLTRFAGILRPEVLEAQADAARRIEAGEGRLRALFDFSDVEVVDISIETLRDVARLPQNLPGQVRVYVMPRAGQFAQGRFFAIHQGLSGNIEPEICSTMAEAYESLNLSDPDFQPVP